MASKVIVKIPVAPFGQVNKSKSGSVNGEIVVPRANNNPDNIATSKSPEPLKGSENPRIAQLEQNVRFLQEQHELMLTGLHSEVENLKNRNRELQFQLVFVKAGSIPSSPSSPEDDAKHKVYSSPKPFNVTPLQVELLEKEMGELKLQLQEAENRNVYLSAIVDEQKKKLERYERDREKERERSLQPDPELLRKLDDAESIIRRIRRENSDLRRENSAGVSHYHHHRDSTINHQNRDQVSYHLQSPRGAINHQGGRGGNGRHRGNGSGVGGNHYHRGNWFPPLHSQSYWQGGRTNDRTGSTATAEGALPSLQQPSDSSSGGHQYQGRRGTNNNHYHNGDGRKYRGGYHKAGKPS